MGLISKFKEMFFEEDEEAKEGYTREIEIPKSEEVTEAKIEQKEIAEIENTVAEKDLYKSPATFKFPVIFEDEDLKPSIQEKKHSNFNNRIKPKEEKVVEKKFTASPIISPIYGILDKNYKSEEITNKSEQPDYESKRNYKKIDVDVIRQKAFGTLEEELEQTMFENTSYSLPKYNAEEVDPIAEEMGLTGKVKIEEPKSSNISIEEAYENYSDYGVSYHKETVTIDTEEYSEEVGQKTEVLEEDLFVLINSMYKDSEEDSEEDK